MGPPCTFSLIYRPKISTIGSRMSELKQLSQVKFFLLGQIVKARVVVVDVVDGGVAVR